MGGVVPIPCSVICFYGRSLLLCYILLILIGRRLGSSLFLGSKFVIVEYFILQFLFMSLEVPAHGFVMGSWLFLGSFSGNLLFQSCVALIFWFPIFGVGCLGYMEGSCWGSWSLFEQFVSHVWCHQAGRYVWW